MLMVLLDRSALAETIHSLTRICSWQHTSAMNSRVLAALAEPNRLRIVELLGESPRAVGEIAGALGLRQPQVTKHLQRLERSGLVEMHPLGRRRIYSLRRQELRALRDWLDRFGPDHPSEDVLIRYRAAIEAEQALSEPERRASRTFEFERELPAPTSRVWRAWTTAAVVRRWWSPQHFQVADCEVDAVPGGRLRIVMAEGDGTRYEAAGRFIALNRPRSLTFELAPLDPTGEPLFSAINEVQLTRRGQRTELRLTIRVSNIQIQGAPALAGIPFGWEQTLDKLEAELSPDRPSPAAGPMPA
jgi:uncharacterized protein YndB with AHSA1/START domain/DNA-binding transcriptional ArsR family regulator